MMLNRSGKDGYFCFFLMLEKKLFNLLSLIIKLGVVIGFLFFEKHFVRLKKFPFDYSLSQKDVAVFQMLFLQILQKIIFLFNDLDVFSFSSLIIFIIATLVQ